jgi:hypothetical protein
MPDDVVVPDPVPYERLSIERADTESVTVSLTFLSNMGVPERRYAWTCAVVEPGGPMGVAAAAAQATRNCYADARKDRRESQW